MTVSKERLLSEDYMELRCVKHTQKNRFVLMQEKVLFSMNI